jgi:5-methyltetrahydropteroyltriglutamate--homocysteine methyltransferase
VYAAELINQVIAGIDGIRIGIHVCRGNWSRNEDVLLSGDYQPLIPAFSNMNVRQYVLEYATPRAGDIRIVGEALGQKEIGLGVVNPRTEAVESVDEIVSRVKQALTWYRPEQIFLNPDCGFGCFANRCVNEEEVAFAKIGQIVKSARILREKYT